MSLCRIAKAQRVRLRKLPRFLGRALFSSVLIVACGIDLSARLLDFAWDYVYPLTLTWKTWLESGRALALYQRPTKPGPGTAVSTGPMTVVPLMRARTVLPAKTMSARKVCPGSAMMEWKTLPRKL